MKKNIFKFLIIFIVSYPFILFLNTGFLTDSSIKIFQALIFAIVFSTIAVWSNLRRIILLASLCLILIMAAFYIVDMIELADIFGSTAVGLILLTIISFLPQLFKKGYIEKL